jgi:hypothetical protein
MSTLPRPWTCNVPCVSLAQPADRSSRPQTNFLYLPSTHSLPVVSSCQAFRFKLYATFRSLTCYLTHSSHNPASNLRIFWNQHHLWSFWICNFLQPHVTFSTLKMNSSPQQPVLKRPQSIIYILPLKSETIFHNNINNKCSYSFVYILPYIFW